MSDTETQEAQLTAATAAKRVKRVILEAVDGKDKPRETRVAVAEEEVLSFKDYGTHVVVVTVDGQKLTGK
jgi:hypothetical protein